MKRHMPIQFRNDIKTVPYVEHIPTKEELNKANEMYKGEEMKRYKITLTFETDDSTGEMEQELQEKGLDHIEEMLAIGFTDPEFEKLTCTIKEIKNEHN
jgi:hypothetical protein